MMGFSSQRSKPSNQFNGLSGEPPSGHGESGAGRSSKGRKTPLSQIWQTSLLRTQDEYDPKADTEIAIEETTPQSRASSGGQRAGAEIDEERRATRTRERRYDNDSQEELTVDLRVSPAEEQDDRRWGGRGIMKVQTITVTEDRI